MSASIDTLKHNETTINTNNTANTTENELYKLYKCIQNSNSSENEYNYERCHHNNEQNQKVHKDKDERQKYSGIDYTREIQKCLSNLTEKYDNQNDEPSESDEEEYVSKKELEIDELEETNRYLKLDLSNEKLKVIEIQKLLEEERSSNYNNRRTIMFIKNCLRFLENEMNDIGNFCPEMKYNEFIINNGIQFQKYKEQYETLKQITIEDLYIKKTLDSMITQKFTLLESRYNSMNETIERVLEQYKKSKNIKILLQALILFYLLNIIIYFSF